MWDFLHLMTIELGHSHIHGAKSLGSLECFTTIGVRSFCSELLSRHWLHNRACYFIFQNSTRDETTPSQPNHAPHEIANQNIYQNSGFVPSTNPTGESIKPPQSNIAPHEIANQNIYHNSGFVPSTSPPEGSATTAPVYMALENKQVYNFLASSVYLLKCYMCIGLSCAHPI